MESTMKKNLEEMFNCGNCSYTCFDPNDTDEKRKCSGDGRFNELPVNSGIKYLIEKYDLKNVCKYWRDRK